MAYLPAGLSHALVAISILIGVLQCFFGYRIFRIILGLIGFFIGSAVMAFVGYAMFGLAAMAFLAGVIGGLVGAILLAVFYSVGVFLIGAFLGAVSGIVLFAAAGATPQLVVLLIPAVLGGGIALFYKRLMIILSTAFVGSWSIVTGIAYFAESAVRPVYSERLSFLLEEHLPIILLSWILLGIVGMVAQYRLAPAKEKHAQSAPSGAE